MQIVKLPTLETGQWVQVMAIPLGSFVILSKLLNFSQLHFSTLQNEYDDKGNDFTELWLGGSEISHVGWSF